MDLYKTTKLLPWLEKQEINWKSLSHNPSAIYLLEQNPDKINWTWLSLNTAAIHLIEQNPDKINWTWLSINKNAIYYLMLSKRT
jgi:ribosomal protein L24E